MAKSKTYVLGMFPYPSGDGLHVGHVRIYTAVDVMARYFRMSERNEKWEQQGSELPKSSEPTGKSKLRVLSPMGWDAFGLPAENAAIKHKTNPQEIVPRNYNNFRSQMKNLDFAFDWEREFATTDPSYYGLTQWIFLELYKKGLVYREQVPINWCPKCKTGLANEEVLPDGTHERCGTATGKKDLPQWVMKITEYADRLLGDLDVELGKYFEKGASLQGSELPKSSEPRTLDWPRGILEMQRNWIGKKEGVRLFHKVEGMDIQLSAFSAYPIWCFADTFMAIAPEHPLVKKLVEGTKYEKEVIAFVEESGKITAEQRTEDKFEKKGIFTGRYTNDPFNPGKKLPVWVANFAMMGFGTGIIRCSAHDPRDYEFAMKYRIPLKEVVERIDPNEPVNAHTNEGALKDSGVFSGKKITKESIEEVKDWIEKEGIGQRETTYHLRDWVFSRQRYWGEPIPLIYCEHCGKNESKGSELSFTTLQSAESSEPVRVAIVPIPERDLPLTLPYLESYEPTDTGESPLSRVEEWVNTTCPRCGGEARRETDTMPNWAGSCWYHLAFAFWREEDGMQGSELPKSSEPDRSTKQVIEEYKKKSETPFTDFWKEVAKPEIDKWLPVDWYLGGAEHAVLHLLYARFWNKVLYDLGHLSFPEPYLRLRSVGMVLAPDGRKMSKSWGNVINPDDVIKEHGSDAVRLYEMFMGPWDQTTSWDPRALIGMKRFLERVREVTSDKSKVVSGETSPRLAVQLSKLVTQVAKGIVEQKFNTAIAAQMEFVNAWRNSDLVLSREHALNFAQIMSPFSPKTAQIVWEAVGAQGSELPKSSEPRRVQDSGWPSVTADEVEVQVTIAVQVNGRLRSTVEVSGKIAEDQEQVVEMVLGNEKVKKWVTGAIKKTIFVPGKLVNLVV